MEVNLDAAIEAQLQERKEELARQRAIIKKNRRIPYDFMERAKAALEVKFPDAVRVEPKMYMNHVYCEVWDAEGRAQIYFCYERD